MSDPRRHTLERCRAGRSALLLLGVTTVLWMSSATALAQASRGKRWIAPDGPRTRVAFDTGLGIHPAPVRWWVADAEVDSEPGFMVRAAFGLNANDRIRPLRAFGQFAVGWRWWRKLELGAAALLTSGREIGASSSPRFLAAGHGFYFGAGVPDGLRVSFVIGNSYGDPSGQGAVVLAYRTQVPVAVTGSFRLLIVARGFFSWPRPVLSVHRLQLEAILEGQWKVFGGAIFDGGDGSAMAGPSVGGNVGFVLGMGVRTR